jgi:hypothetical protein
MKTEAGNLKKQCAKRVINRDKKLETRIKTKNLWNHNNKQGMNQILNNVKGDRWIWLIVIVLSVLSLLAVYSSTGTLAYKQGVKQMKRI